MLCVETRDGAGEPMDVVLGAFHAPYAAHATHAADEREDLVKHAVEAIQVALQSFD